MTCQEIKELLWLYQAGETEPGLTNHIDEHLKGCVVCSNENAQLKNLIQKLPLTPKHSNDYWESYTEEIIKRIETDQMEKPFFLWRWVPVMVLLLVFIGGITYYKIQENKKFNEIITNLDLLENMEVLENDKLFNEKT